MTNITSENKFSVSPVKLESRKHGPKSLSIVIPCYNEVEVLPILRDRLDSVLAKVEFDVEIILINDGSSDGTLNSLRSYASEDQRVRVVSLSRNFGHQLALTCGLDYVKGEVILIMDADLQDPPELLFEMIDRWKEGYDVVYGQRLERLGESAIKKVCAFLFYRIFEKIINLKVPRDTGDFRLLDISALEALQRLRERHRFIRGMVSWVGFNQIAVKYERPVREAGETKYPFKKSLFLAFDAIISFSYAPLRIATYLGVAISSFSFFYILVVIGLKITLLTTGIKIAETPGYTSIMAFLLLLGGVQLIVLGVIGEYVGRIFEQGQGRPLYIVDEILGFEE